MAGHSKRHNIKHRKAAEDAKKSKVYSKMAKLIEIAARNGADPMMNPSLDMVLTKAKYASVPKDVIERAIKKGSGQAGGAEYQTLFYEGYAPGGVALYIKTLSDNTNRTATNIRSLLGKSGGTMAEMGAVSRQFKEIGEIVITGIISKIKIKGVDIEQELPFDVTTLEEQLLELPISDYTIEEGICRVITSKEYFHTVLKSIEGLGYKLAQGDLVWESTNKVDIDDDAYTKIEKIRDILEDDDDIEEVYDNVA